VSGAVNEVVIGGGGISTSVGVDKRQAITRFLHRISTTRLPTLVRRVQVIPGTHRIIIIIIESYNIILGNYAGG
jgi:hypothetical protein